MTVIARMAWPENGLSDYNRVIAALGSELHGVGEPGGIYHAAIGDEHSLQIIDVWESQEAMQEFVEQRLGPVLGSLQFPPPATVELLPAYNLIVPPDGPKNAPGGVRVLFDGPEMTAAQYDQANRELAEIGQTHPEGRVFHVAAESPRGWFIMDIWDSLASASAFAPTLRPIVDRVGVPTDSRPQHDPLHNTLIAPGAVAGSTTQLAAAFPVLPGKETQAQAFFAELMGPRHAEYASKRHHLGVRERAHLQHTPHGDMVVLTVEGKSPAAAFAQFGQGDDNFTTWFVQQVEEIHGIDLHQPPAEEPPQMVVDSGSITEQNKAVVRRFLDSVLGEHNVEALDELAGPGYQNHLPVSQAPLDLEGTKVALRDFFEAFPDMKHRAKETVAEGDLVLTRYSVTATHRGTFGGIPATGRQVTVSGTSLYRLHDGKIVEDDPGFSPIEILAQLGVEPAGVR